MVDRTEWGKYKTELRKAYFEGQRPVISQEHSTYRDFWAFFDKFAAASRSKGLDDGAHASTSTASFNEHGIPNRHELRFKQRYSFDLEKSQRYMIRNVPEHLVQRFEFILSSYIEFLQREKQNKLRKLEEAQQNLPIAHYRQEILDKLREEQVLVVAGDTGCGKSTQVPQYLLAAGYSNIACTQPRRIACIALSNRVAYETLNEYGSKVAYQIRFERTRTRATRLVFLTEGLLLRQLGTSPTLEQYNVIILDERHLTSDLLMGVLKRLLHDRHDLRLILMSATINVEQFSLYFDRCPIVQVPGRLFPIKTHYRPIPKMKRADEPKGKANNNRIDPKPYIDVLRVVDQKTPQSERGDVLVFLRYWA